MSATATGDDVALRQLPESVPDVGAPEPANRTGTAVGLEYFQMRCSVEPAAFSPGTLAT
ncbi:MAG: hypothetical protein IPG50_32400 [Myxococcales bacterium]|nr:hypothetical protein [Myxococcales bacterium]